MKVNIQKLQGGGFATFTPIIHTAPTAGSTSKESESKTQKSASILDDDTFKELLKEGGLTNEVNEFVNQVIKLESSSELGLPYLNRDTRSSALRLVAQVNELKNNKTQWTKSAQTAEASGGLDEVAVNGSNLYVKDESGVVSTVSFRDYKKVAGKVKVLTVAELLNERNLNPNLIGRNDVFVAGNQSIGIEKINDTITTLVKALSSAKIEDEKVYDRSYFEKQMEYLSSIKSVTGVEPTEDEKRAINELGHMLQNPSEYFKMTTSEDVRGGHLKTAYNYLWKAIGLAGQQKLTALAVINGENDPTTYIKDLLLSQAAPGSSTKILPVDENGGTGSRAGADNGAKSLTNWQMFNKEKLRTADLSFVFNDPDQSVLFRGTIGAVGPLITPNDESIPAATIGNILKTQWNQVVDTSKVTFGNRQVSSYELDSLVFNGIDDVAKVYMPVKNGVPDYESLEIWNELYNIYKMNEDKWSAREAEKWFKDHGFNIVFDEKYEDGKKVKILRDNSQVKPFLLIPAYTNDASTLVEGNEKWLRELGSEEEELLMPTFMQAWTVGTGKNTQSLKPKDAIGWNDKYYSGMVAIPYRVGSDAIVDALANQGPREKPALMSTVRTNLQNSVAPVRGTRARELNRQ